MFIELNGEVFRVLKELQGGGCYVISTASPTSITFIDMATFERAERVAAPESFSNVSKGDSSRYQLIESLLEDEGCVMDRGRLLEVAGKVAEAEGTTKKRILRLFHNYLGTGRTTPGRAAAHEQEKKPIIDAAIRKYYFSAKRLSLKESYALMLAESFTEEDGSLKQERPSFNSFRHYFYRHGYHKMAQREIAREGLTSYQRNSRPLYGSQSSWRDRLGTFQMDATIADIHLVDQYDNSTVIGRPNIYLAVDTASQLIAGVYVGMEQGETSVLACILNAAADKVEFCQEYGITITPDQWPNTGLPKRIVVDRGREFFGERVDELCTKYGMVVERLAAFRPDLKGTVEKSFHLIQEKYKPLLRGKGVIEDHAQERWAVDYRKQACLTLREFTAIVIQCIIYLNSARTLQNLMPEQVEATPTAAGLWEWCTKNDKSDMLVVSYKDLRRISLHRAKASMTRTGLIFRRLRYLNQDYKANQFEAGISGNKAVTVAYDDAQTGEIFLIEEDGSYVPFQLAPANERFGEMGFAEYGRLIQKIKEQAKAQQERELEGQLLLHKSIKNIIQREAVGE